MSKTRIIITAVIAAGLGLGLTGCTGASAASAAPAVQHVTHEGAAVADGCTELTAWGAELLTNDGFSSTDYHPVGTWYAFRDPARWAGYLIGGEVGPGVQGVAVYSTMDLDGLHDVATLNTQADEAAQIDAYRDTWSANTDLHPASDRLSSDWTPDVDTAVLADGLAGCWDDGRAVKLDPIAGAVATAAAPTADPSKPILTVTAVLSGDTFMAESQYGSFTVHLLGVTAPVSSSCEGQYAFGKLALLLPEGTVFTYDESSAGDWEDNLEPAIDYIYVEAGGEDIGLAMIKSGWTKADSELKWGSHDRETEYEAADAKYPDFPCPKVV